MSPTGELSQFAFLLLLVLGGKEVCFLMQRTTVNSVVGEPKHSVLLERVFLVQQGRKPVPELSLKKYRSTASLVTIPLSIPARSVVSIL